ncbi:hypothetical protein BGZ83_011185 [Gryganskiella cystojenkinii]|nr:hypothetical protein BGZ83_011185 [Gryganskiella cystojenkinii]
MPSTPSRPLSNQLIINTHNLSQAHNRGSPRSANASSAVSFKDHPMRPPIEKRLSYGPSSLGPNAHHQPHSNLGNGNGSNMTSPKTGGPGGGGHHPFHNLGQPQRGTRQSLALTVLRVLAGAPAFFGMCYSLNVAWENKLDGFQHPRRSASTDESDRESSFDDLSLTRSDFWVASM